MAAKYAAKRIRQNRPEKRNGRMAVNAMPVPKKPNSAHRTDEKHSSVPVPSKTAMAPVPLRGGKTQARDRTIVPRFDVANSCSSTRLVLSRTGTPQAYGASMVLSHRYGALPVLGSTGNVTQSFSTSRSWQYWHPKGTGTTLILGGTGMGKAHTVHRASRGTGSF